MIEGNRLSFHFMGIGGIGQSALAKMALWHGHQVTGCDNAISETTREMETMGIQVFRGHDPRHLDGVDYLVVSDAIRHDEAEKQNAQARNIGVMRRGEMLGLLMNDCVGQKVGVAGTHGKSTTTAMLGVGLQEAGMDPTVVIGAEVAALGGNVRRGHGPVFVAEACEAFGSFLFLKPTIALITNIEADHLDYYQNMDNIKTAYSRFLENVPDDGTVIACGEDPTATEAASKSGRRFLTYGVKEETFDFHGKIISHWEDQTVFRVWHGNQELGEVRLSVPGRHNVLNALAALSAGVRLKVDLHRFIRGLSNYRGAGRRFERLGERNGILYYSDYAHHPTEIIATIQAARSRYPDRRLIVVFQPHLFSRTKLFMDDFADALAAADVVIVTGIYAAREDPIEGVSAESLYQRLAVRESGLEVYCIEEENDVPARLERIAGSGDFVIFMGAGSIHEVGVNYLKGLNVR